MLKSLAERCLSGKRISRVPWESKRCCIKTITHRISQLSVFLQTSALQTHYLSVWINQSGFWINIQLNWCFVKDIYSAIFAVINVYVTLDHKTSHKGQFFEIEIYTSSEIWINKFYWCMVCYDRTIFGRDATIWKSGIWGCKKNLNIEKITFKVVQMMFLAMHISNMIYS